MMDSDFGAMFFVCRAKVTLQVILFIFVIAFVEMERNNEHIEREMVCFLFFNILVYAGRRENK